MTQVSDVAPGPLVRNRGSLRSDDIWFYGNEQIEIVGQFCYLGLLLNFDGKFHVKQKTVIITM
jgi:hypothetical protein